MNIKQSEKLLLPKDSDAYSFVTIVVQREVERFQIGVKDKLPINSLTGLITKNITCVYII